MVDHGYHPGKLIPALEAICPQIMTKIRFKKMSKQQHLGISGFVVMPMRWIVESSNAWIECCKSLVKNFDRTLDNTKLMPESTFALSGLCLSSLLKLPKIPNGFYIAAMRLDDGDLLVVATAHDPYTAISDYAKRWAIETLFGCFKSRGFCLESTHLQHSEHLAKLIAFLTIALCWCFSSGLWQSIINPLMPKKHGRLPKSIFRLGFDFLRDIILNLHVHTNSTAFFNSFNFLSCT